MRILILSFYLAPYNTIAAHRITALARYLQSNGHEVKVLTARHDDIPRDFSADLAGIELIETRRSPLAGLFPSRTDAGEPPASSAGQRTPGFLRGLLRPLRHVLVWPDKHAGWLWLALPAAVRTARKWRPDLIYASSPPATCMALGAIVAKLTRVPWVCEIRDRWADDPYSPRPQWRKAAERRLERIMLGAAQGIVTVSQTWAGEYGARYGKPVQAIYSGFDPELYQGVPARPAAGLPLRLVYTGSVYAGRDPAPLWQALAAMGAAANDIRVEFYGARREEVLPDAAQYGVDHLVQVEEYVSHGRAVELQCGADVLLMLQWDNPSEAGNMPGKLFEYLGAGRPILAMGYAGGEMARVIGQTGAGLFSNDPVEITKQLREWLISKQHAAGCQKSSGSGQSNLTRDNQFCKLEIFLSSG